MPNARQPTRKVSASPPKPSAKSKNSSDSAKKIKPMKIYSNLLKPIKALEYFWGHRKYFLRYQAEWIADDSLLKIIQKGRQTGITYADAYESVFKVCPKGAEVD